MGKLWEYLLVKSAIQELKKKEKKESDIK